MPVTINVSLFHADDSLRENLLMFNQTGYCYVLPAYEIVRNVSEVLEVEFRIYVKCVDSKSRV
jgi:hypothetical protein